LDILLYNEEIVNDEKIISEKKEEFYLSIPHIRMHERLFVLKPLCDIEHMKEFYLRNIKRNIKAINLLFGFLREKIHADVNYECLYEENFYRNINKITKLDYLTNILIFSEKKIAKNIKFDKTCDKNKNERYITDCKNIEMLNDFTDEK